VTVPGFLTPPESSICPAGRRGCGSSSAPSDPTPARSYGSPTCTATGSPPSSPTPPAANSPTSNSATAAARCEDRIRVSKNTGLANLPLHGYAQNQIWLALVTLAVELTAWMQTLALTGHDARRWEPKRLRLRLFSTPGRIAHHARKTHLRLPRHAPHADLITTARHHLTALLQLA
jgi:Transposase DDE domain group 1